MRKILIILSITLCLFGCSEIGKENIDNDQLYLSLINSIKEHENFQTVSNHFDIYAEIAKIDGGYRYYVTIDNPKIALYDVEAIAIEKDVDYANTMAANVGIFEDSVYSLIPNQKNHDKGYVEGLVISGTTNNPDTKLYVYVSFKNEDYSNNYIEYFKLDAKYEAN